MEKQKYQLRIFSTGITAYSNNLKPLQNLANSAALDFEGRIGYDIISTETGEVMALQKDGLECTLSDLREIISVRLYHTLLKHIVEITGLDTDEALKEITMRDIREMVLNGKFVAIRHMGTKAYMEFYSTLIDYCGNTRITRLAINENISLNQDKGVFDVTFDKVFNAYWLDLSIFSHE